MPLNVNKDSSGCKASQRVHIYSNRSPKGYSCRITAWPSASPWRVNPFCCDLCLCPSGFVGSQIIQKTSNISREHQNDMHLWRIQSIWRIEDSILGGTRWSQKAVWSVNLGCKSQVLKTTQCFATGTYLSCSPSELVPRSAPRFFLPPARLSYARCLDMTSGILQKQTGWWGHVYSRDVHFARLTTGKNNDLRD
jgi:hypothetical protein